MPLDSVGVLHTSSRISSPDQKDFFTFPDDMLSWFAGFKPKTTQETEVEIVYINEQLTVPERWGELATDINNDDLLTMDENVGMCGTLSDGEIIEEVRSKHESSGEEENTDI
uniref:Uncharacterized protein n=1 Tax=Timema douglasi TaxID=61478 RepID=A0A7R8VCB0_TIMDO|nr:unnamed protein product [Timema douglasi]